MAIGESNAAAVAARVRQQNANPLRVRVMRGSDDSVAANGAGKLRVRASTPVSNGTRALVFERTPNTIAHAKHDRAR
ncbi:MAG TPA: hypothetical protein VIK60_00820 [Vicinamibacterales bacterium]